jgi:hypothetical protein
MSEAEHGNAPLTPEEQQVELLEGCGNPVRDGVRFLTPGFPPVRALMT